jgi:hypothetical protein
MKEVILLRKALRIAADDFHKHGIIMRGMKKYLLEKTTEEWIIRHIELWLSRAKTEEI